MAPATGLHAVPMLGSLSIKARPSAVSLFAAMIPYWRRVLPHSCWVAGTRCAAERCNPPTAVFVHTRYRRSVSGDGIPCRADPKDLAERLWVSLQSRQKRLAAPFWEAANH